MYSSEIARDFARDYYGSLFQKDGNLHDLYCENAHIDHSMEGQTNDLGSVKGAEAVDTLLKRYENGKVMITDVTGVKGGTNQVLVVVFGDLFRVGEAKSFNFTQVLLLRKQKGASRYRILSDVLKLLQPEIPKAIARASPPASAELANGVERTLKSGGRSKQREVKQQRKSASVSPVRAKPRREASSDAEKSSTSGRSANGKTKDGKKRSADAKDESSDSTVSTESTPVDTTLVETSSVDSKAGDAGDEKEKTREAAPSESAPRKSFKFTAESAAKASKFQPSKSFQPALHSPQIIPPQMIPQYQAYQGYVPYYQMGFPDPMPGQPAMHIPPFRPPQPPPSRPPHQ